MRFRSTSPPLGVDFRKLWTATTISQVGDGVTLVAGPLLVASATKSPLYVSGAMFVNSLPRLLLSLVSGVFVDRVDRRRLMVAVGVLRGVVVGALAIGILAGVAVIPLVYAATFLLGVGETLAHTASTSQLPSVVPAERLGTANARLLAGYAVGNQFLAKPLGAYLFVVSAALPFGFDSLSFFVFAALMANLRQAPPPAPDTPRRSLREEAAEGVRWLFRHKLLRTLAISMGIGNLVYSAAFAVFVLYTRERLGVTEIGYGLLLTTFAIGGLIGTASADWLTARFGTVPLLRAGLLVEALMHLTLAITTRPFAAAAILILFGVQTMVWGIIVITLRQRLVPDQLLGRVSSVHLLVDAIGITLGSLLGGTLADVFGITGPYWIAGITMILVTLISWRSLARANSPGRTETESLAD